MTVAAQPRYLLFPDPIRPGEDLFGYLLRRAERGGAGNIHALGRAIGLTRYALKLTHIAGAYDRLAKVLREDPERLRASGFTVTGTQQKAPVVGFAGQRLRRSAIAFPKSRICPACLAADGHAHQVWQIAALTECPRHQIRLIDECSACGQSLTWRRRSLTRCICGFDLRRLPRLSSPAHALALSAEIARRAAGEAPKLFAGTTSDATGRLETFVDLCVMTGARVLGWKYKLLIDRSLTIAEARALLDAAGPILLEPEEEGYFQFLDRIFVPPGQKGGRLIRMFPGWYQSLGRFEFLVPLRPGLLRYLQKRHPAQFIRLTVKSTLIRADQADLETISVSEAAPRIGRTTETLLAMAEKLGVQPIVTERGQRLVRRRLLARDFQRIVEACLGGGMMLPPRPCPPAGLKVRRSRLNGGRLMLARAEVRKRWSSIPFPGTNLETTFPPDLLVPATAIADRLGVDTGAVYDLLKAGILQSCGATEDSRRAEGPTMGNDAAFERALAVAVNSNAAPPTEQLVPLMDSYVGTVRRHGVGIPVLIAAILDGTLGPIYRSISGKGLRGLLLTKAAVDSYARRAQRNQLQDLLTSDQVAKCIGAGDGKIVSHLRLKGFLKATDRKLGSNYGYDRVSVERFCETHISLQEILRRRLFPEFGRLPAWLRRHLDDNGLQPVMARDLDGAPMTFYRRVEIEEHAASLRIRRNKAAEPGRDGEADRAIA